MDNSHSTKEYWKDWYWNRGGREKVKTGYYMTKEFVQSNMSNLLEDIRRNCISINLGVVDTMWVCDVMNNEKMGSLIAFAYESPQCDTPVDALYDAYTWLIKNGKVELDA